MALQSIDARDLACIRGGRLVFRAVSFGLRAGCALSVEGPNGSGKTSLLRLIAGFLRPEEGAIHLELKGGRSVAAREDRGAFVGWLGHQDGAKAQMSAREILRFYARLYGTPETEIPATLDLVALKRAGDLPVQFLSAGQKKRLALARLKLSNRPLWLLDEPLAALDSAGRGLVSQFIKSHCANGGMAIAATHEPLGIDSERLSLAA